MVHKTTVANFEISHLRYLNEHSKLTQNLPTFADDKTLIELLRLMTLTRELDQQIINLQRTGQMGTYPSCQGAEAFSVGIGHAIYKDDVFCPYYRDQGTTIFRPQGIMGLLQYWGGDERGNNIDSLDQDLPISVPIASQCLHAVGVAYALQYRKQNRAVICTIGDGGTSEGDFYEAINLAGTWKLPVVFVINNNQWAISVPLSAQTACQTIAQKAIGAGIDGEQIDGNDVIAVRETVREAIDKARSGNGPTVIETLTFRLSDHTTADDATRYQPQDVVQQESKKEPIARLYNYLLATQIITKAQYEKMSQKCKADIDKSIEEFLKIPKDKATSPFDHLYENLPEALIDQYHEIGATK